MNMTTPFQAGKTPIALPSAKSATTAARKVTARPETTRHIHYDCTPGLTVDGVVFVFCQNHGRPCWKAVAQIGTIFGTEVEGELVGIGKTKKIALDRLAEEKRKLSESLWA